MGGRYTGEGEVKEEEGEETYPQKKKKWEANNSSQEELMKSSLTLKLSRET